MLMCVDTWLLSTIVDKAALPIVSTNVAALTTYSTPLGGGACGVYYMGRWRQITAVAHM